MASDWSRGSLTVVGTGIMLGAPLAVLFVQQHGWDLKRWFPKALLGLIPPMGLVIFGWFLQRQGLTFFACQEQQWQWNRFSAHPGRTFQCVFQGCEATVRTFNNQTYEVRPDVTAPESPGAGTEK